METKNFKVKFMSSPEVELTFESLDEAKEGAKKWVIENKVIFDEMRVYEGDENVVSFNYYKDIKKNPVFVEF